MRLFGLTATILAVPLLLSACAPVPFNGERTPSVSPPPARGTALREAADPWFSDPAGQSGFIPLAQGEEALGARLRLMEEAERTIDAQYFLLKPDLSTGLMAAGMVQAADRGVRVRLLVDDVFTTVDDADFAHLNAHPNIEVRIFNPLARGGPSWLAFLRDFPRTNRRMHNKAFIADNSLAVVGGRNIADEYFAVEQEIEFADFDIVAVGPVVLQISTSFDSYWNSRLSVPMQALAPPPTQSATGEVWDIAIQDPEILRRAREVYDDSIDSPILLRLRSGTWTPPSGTAEITVDPPAKLSFPRDANLNPLYQQLVGEIDAATSELILITPYFVPDRDLVNRLAAARSRGVRVVVVTNSLASNNHAYVHGGYFPWRRELLTMGVELYEARADAAISRVTGEQQHLTMHTKGAIIDRKTVLVSSMNLDPRSIELNSEIGLFISSPELGQYFASSITEDLPEFAWTLDLDASGQVIWHAGRGDTTAIHTSEPGAGFFARLTALLTAMLPVKGQL